MVVVEGVDAGGTNGRGCVFGDRLEVDIIGGVSGIVFGVCGSGMSVLGRLSSVDDRREWWCWMGGCCWRIRICCAIAEVGL